MKKLGVFITTHIGNEVIRHGGDFAERVFPKFRDITIGNYLKYDPGVEIDIFIMDTGSTYKEYLDWSQEILEKKVTVLRIPNHGGVFASLKNVMHVNEYLKENYEYFLFHTDDSVHIEGDNWARELIDEYKSYENMGIIGRELTMIRLSKDGLVDHRNCCPHIAEIWGITRISTIPHLHADWYFLNRDTLLDLSKVWYKAISSESAMQYQEKWENTNYVEVANLSDRRKTLDNFHIGREVDVSVRVEYMNRRLAGYKGNKVIWQKY